MFHHRSHTVRPRRASRLGGTALALVLASAALAGCDAGGEAAATAAPRLGTKLRLVEEGLVVPRDARLETGAWKVLDGTGRPALTGTVAFAPRVACGAAGDAQKPGRTCTVFVPNDLPQSPATILHWRGSRRAQPDEAKGSGRRPRTAQLLKRPRVGMPLGKLRLGEATGARLHQAPPLAKRALVSEPLVVPPDAVLRLSFGVDEPAWHVDSAPVYFRVSVETDDGASQDLLRRVLDPARRPTDRRWFDVDVDLTDLAGREVRLRFTTDPAESGDARPSLPLWGDPRILAPEAAPEHARPSIVLVSLDTLRAKSVSAYGYDLDTMPTFDAYARGGALFENAFTTFSNTLGSHMSMLTGLYPATHGVRLPRLRLDADRPMLAELLRRAGYATAAFTENALLDSRYGFRRGFSTYFENTEIGIGAGDADGTFGRALEWIGRHADEQFFAFVHTYEVHAPHAPPPAHRKLFLDARPPRSNAQLTYEQTIRHLDDELQLLLDGLRLAMPERELLVVLTADHGEEFGEHGLVGHVQIYDEVMHIPLVMVWPGRIPAGRRVATPVSLVDLVPTLLELASLPVPAGVDGSSLVPLLGERPGKLEREVVFAEQPPMIASSTPRFAARSAGVKCILDVDPSVPDACYDLAADPGETQPLDPGTAPELAQVRAAADAYRTRALQGAPPGGPPGGGEAEPTPAPGDAAPAAPDDDIERKLRALGYTE